MFQTVRISKEMIAKMLHLPDGVAVASAHTDTQNLACVFVVVDPRNLLGVDDDHDVYFDVGSGEWKRCPIKGSTRGAELDDQAGA